MDLGSGAGYPGIPIAVMRAGFQVTLLDATRKKVRRLEEFAADLPQVIAVWGRAEEVSRHRKSTAGSLPDNGLMGSGRVWARAVGPLPVLVELGFGLLRAGGVLLAWKGPEVAGEEWDAAQSAAQALGGRALGTRRYELPMGAGERLLIAFARGEKELPSGFPRAPAVIRRRPLS